MSKSKSCPKCGKLMNRQSHICRECYLLFKISPESYFVKRCPICFKKFRVHKIHINRGQGKYCSRSCARRGSPTRKKESPLLICYTCQKKFYKYKSEIVKNVGNKHFCSSRCWYEHNQFENHYGWAGGQNERNNPDYYRWRKKVLKRDHGFCRLCPSKDNIEVHHIKRFKNRDMRWEVSNGISLCYDCHTKFRNKEELYEGILSFIASVPVEVWYV